MGIRQAVFGRTFRCPRPVSESGATAEHLEKTAALSFWLKTDPANSAANGTIIGDSKGMEWGTIMPDGKLAVRQQGKTIASTSQNVNDNQWHHIVIQRQADNGQVSIYMDGTLSGQGTGTSGTLPGEYAGFGSAQGANNTSAFWIKYTFSTKRFPRKPSFN